MVSEHWSSNLLIHEFFVEVFPKPIDTMYCHPPELGKRVENGRFYSYLKIFILNRLILL